MKIAVSTKGKSLDSQVEPRFGNSRGFVLFDTESGNTDYLSNADQLGIARSKGIQTAQMIAEAGATALVIGQLGSNAARVLKKRGIKIYACADGTVREAVQAVEQQKLKELGEDKIQPGPGKMGGRGMGGGGRGRGFSQRG